MLEIDTLVIAQVLFLFMLAAVTERAAAIVINLYPSAFDADISGTELSSATVITVVVGLIAGWLVVDVFEIDLIGSVFQIQAEHHEWLNAIGLALGAEFLRPVRKRLMASKGGAQAQWTR